MKKIVFVLLIGFSSSYLLKAQISLNIDSFYNAYSKILEIEKSNNNYSKGELKQGFLINKEGDTIYGKVTFFPDGIHVKIENSGFKKKYRADKYKLVKQGDKIILGKKLGKFPVNAFVIESGNISLYYFSCYNSMGNGSSYIYGYYIEKNNELYGRFDNLDMSELKNSPEIIYECISDYSELYDKVKNNAFKNMDIRLMIRIYNTYKNSANNRQITQAGGLAR